MAQEDLLKHRIFRQRQRDTRYHREQSYCAIYGSTVCAIAERTNCATYDSKLCALGDRTKRLLLSRTRAMAIARNVLLTIAHFVYRKEHHANTGGSIRRPSQSEIVRCAASPLKGVRFGDYCCTVHTPAPASSMTIPGMSKALSKSYVYEGVKGLLDCVGSSHLPDTNTLPFS